MITLLTYPISPSGALQDGAGHQVGGRPFRGQQDEEEEATLRFLQVSDTVTSIPA